MTFTFRLGALEWLFYIGANQHLALRDVAAEILNLRAILSLLVMQALVRHLRLGAGICGALRLSHHGVPVAQLHVLLLPVAVQNATCHIGVDGLLPLREVAAVDLLTRCDGPFECPRATLVVVHLALPLNLPTQIVIFLVWPLSHVLLGLEG